MRGESSMGMEVQAAIQIKLRHTDLVKRQLMPKHLLTRFGRKVRSICNVNWTQLLQLVTCIKSHIGGKGRIVGNQKTFRLFRALSLKLGEPTRRTRLRSFHLGLKTKKRNWSRWRKDRKRRLSCKWSLIRLCQMLRKLNKESNIYKLIPLLLRLISLKPCLKTRMRNLTRWSTMLCYMWMSLKKRERLS